MHVGSGEQAAALATPVLRERTVEVGWVGKTLHKFELQLEAPLIADARFLWSASTARRQGAKKVEVKRGDVMGCHSK